MATSYTGLRVQDTYNAIIKIGDNSNLTGTPKLLSDGLGNDSPLYLSGTRLGIGITPAYQFHTSGNAKIGGNLIISGNLTVNGTLTYLNVEDLAVEDPIIKLAKDNTANTLDIGLFGKYVATGTKYKGFFNDASDDKFKLFIGTTVEPTTTVDTSASGYTVGTLVANIEGGTISGTTGTFTGLVSGIAPTSDLNFATKKYVDDQTTPTPALSAVLAVGNTSGSNNLIIQDDDELILGSSSDFRAYHNQTNTLFRIGTGDLIFNSFVTDGDIKFNLDDGAGSLTEYLRLDGGTENIISSKPLVVNEIISSYFTRTGNPNSINTNLYLIDSTDMAAEVGGSIVFSGKYKTDGTLLSGGPFIRAYKENANDSNYSFGLKLGIRLNGSGGNDTALTIKPNKDVVVSEGDLKVDSSSGDSVLILDNSSQLLRIDQNSIRTTTNSQITLMTNNSNALQLNTSQQAFFYSDVFIPEYLKHSGDEDNYIQFQADRQTLVAGGTEFIDFANTTQDYITIGGGSDIDVKLVSSTNNKFIFIQGSDGKIGINDLTPSYAFDVNAETRFGSAVNFDSTRYNKGGSSTFWYATTTNARINMDARVEGTGVMIHKWNRNADDNAYLSYEENWYDGNSYNKISSYNDGFMLSGNIRLSSYGAGNITGTLSRLAGFTSDGQFIDVATSSFIDGSGSTGYIPYFTDASSIATTSLYYESADKIRHIQTIGPNDDVRKGFMVEDDTAMAANVGGQIGFRYLYTTGGSDTEGALIRMYKLNAISGDFSSGLKWQVRNTGDDLSTKMTLNPSGFLGLNTTDPNVHLHINSGTAEGWVYVQATGDNAVAGLRTHTSTGNRTNTLYRNRTSNLLTLRSGTDDGEIQFIAGGSVAEAMRIGSSQTVGIGVTNPDAGNGGLQITKTAGTFANSNQKRVASFYDGSVNSEKPGIILGYDDSTTPHGIIAARTQSGTSTIPGLQFFTYNGSWAPRMTILANGNVGISTSTPQKPLHIEGATGSQVLISGASDTIGDTAGILLRAEAGESDSALRAKGGIFFEREAANGLGKLHLAVNGSNNNDSATLANARMTIQQNGRVSIGSTSASANTLTLSGSATEMDMTNTSTNGRQYRLESDSAGLFVIKDRTANSDRIIINSSGDVGINETNPDAKLHINTDGQRIATFESSNSDGPYTAYYLGSTPLGFIGNAQGLANAGSTNMCVRGQSQLVFSISSSEKMRLDSNGYLLINSTSNQTNQALQVNGFIDITNVDSSALRFYNGSTFRGGFGLSKWATAIANSDMVCYAVNHLDIVTNGTSTANFRFRDDSSFTLNFGTHAFVPGYSGIGINVPSGTKKYLGFYDSGTTTYGGGMWYDEASNITSLYSLLNGTQTQHVQLDRATGNTWINPSGGDVAIGHNSPSAQLDIAPASGDADLLLRTASQTLRFDQNSIRGTTSHNIFIFANNNTANGFTLHGAGYVGCGTTTTPTRGEKFYTFGEARFESSVGPNMSIRGGLAHYDTTTGNGTGVGGQLVLGYRYSGNTYTEGAIIKMYKVNSTVGNYSSGLKFQVRNSGEDLSAKMTLNSGGDLSVVGSMTAAGDVIAFSDKRVKTNIKTIDNGLEKISKLRGVSYNRTDIDDKSNKIGVIAQEVKEVLPEVVSYDDEQDRFGVDYGKMAGVFIEAIKDLKAEVDSLKQEIKELKK